MARVLGGCGFHNKWLLYILLLLSTLSESKSLANKIRQRERFKHESSSRQFYDKLHGFPEKGHSTIFQSKVCSELQCSISPITLR